VPAGPVRKKNAKFWSYGCQNKNKMMQINFIFYLEVWESIGSFVIPSYQITTALYV